MVLGLLLFFYAGLLLLPSFWTAIPAASVEGLGLWGQWVESHSRQLGSLIYLLIAIGLIACQGLIANLFVFRHRVAQDVNLFPGVFTVFIAASIPAFHWSLSFHLANICLGFSLLALTDTYRTPSVSDRIFNAGWWIGIAALFVPQYLLFALVAFAGLNSLRAPKLREQLTLLTGVILPFILVGFYYFWYDQLGLFLSQQFAVTFSLIPSLEWNAMPWQVIAQHALMVLLLLMSLFSYRSYNAKTTMEVRKKIDLLYWLLLGAGISILFFRDFHMLHWQMIVLPLGILISFNFTNWSKPTASTLHLLLFLLVIALGVLEIPTLF